MEDTFRDKGLRKRLVEEIINKGIKDSRVIDAINKVPRHFYMDSGFIEFAYKDRAFPISSGQTISQPYTVAFQTELLEISEGDKVLEIGTGSGYQTAILLELGARVYSIERHKDLFLKAGELLKKMGYNPYLFWGDGYLGKSAFQPYNKILITAGAPNIPDELINQLKIGGIMVIPVGSGSSQKMIKLIKTGENKYTTEEHGLFSFVPFLKGKK